MAVKEWDSVETLPATTETSTGSGSNPLPSLYHLMPQTLSEKLKMAEWFSKSGLMPAGLKSPAQILVALQMGHELGIPPMRAVQGISVINGKPTLQADLMLAVALRTGEVEYFDANDITEDHAIVKIKRRGFPTYVSKFTWEDAKRAKLTSRDNWQNYPKRMLKARALAFAVRDTFPDVLAGVYTPDEMIGARDFDAIGDMSKAVDEVIPTVNVGVPIEALRAADEGKLQDHFAATTTADSYNERVGAVQDTQLEQVKRVYNHMTTPLNHSLREESQAAIQAATDEAELDRVYNKVKGLVQEIGVKAAHIMSNLDPDAERVSRWLPALKDTGDIKMLKKFGLLLQEEVRKMSVFTTVTTQPEHTDNRPDDDSTSSVDSNAATVATAEITNGETVASRSETLSEEAREFWYSLTLWIQEDEEKRKQFKQGDLTGWNGDNFPKFRDELRNYGVLENKGHTYWLSRYEDKAVEK